MVYLFGATSSPSCCSFILRRCADDNMTNASSETVLDMKIDFYVDDMLHSVKSVDDAVKSINELSELLESGGFHWTKILCNKREVLQCLPKSEHSPAFKSLNFVENLPIQKNFGEHWDAERDKFIVKVKTDVKSPTRRGV